MRTFWSCKGSSSEGLCSSCGQRDTAPHASARRQMSLSMVAWES
jgi:hypothetical protein